MTVTANDLQLAIAELENVWSTTSDDTSIRNNKPIAKSAMEHFDAIKEHSASIKRQLTLMRSKAQMLLRKVASKVLAACKPLLSCHRVPRRVRSARLPAKRIGSTGKSSDSDGPAPHPRSLSLSIRTFLAPAASILEVRQ